MAVDYIQHFGILGMHWGVRRTPEELGHKPPSGQSGRGGNFARKRTRSSRPSYKRQFREARAQGKKSATEEMTDLLSNTHKMSNSELDYAIRRIEYQQKIQNLTEKQRELNRSVFSRSVERIGNKVIDRAVDKVGDYAWDQVEKAGGFAVGEIQNAVSSKSPKLKKYFLTSEEHSKKSSERTASKKETPKEEKKEMSYDDFMKYLEEKERE